LENLIVNDALIQFPDKQAFEAHARQGCWMPWVREIPWTGSPQRLYEALSHAHAGMSLLLESGRGSSPLGRYSFVLRDPALRFISKGKTQTLTESDESKPFFGDPLEALRKVFGLRPVVGYTGIPLPFVGGAAGLLSYELKNQIERLGSSSLSPNVPDRLVGHTEPTRNCFWGWAIATSSSRYCLFYLEKNGFERFRYSRYTWPLTLEKSRFLALCRSGDIYGGKERRPHRAHRAKRR